MNRAVILLGTNTGDLPVNLQRAVDFIENRCGEIVNASSIYKTEPWGRLDQPYFLNQVITVTTALKARDLLNKLLGIEAEIGRTRNVKWEPRLIDLDILFYNEDVIKEEGLTIPHPHLHERRFTLEPLAEILPDYIHPVFKKTVRELLSCVADASKVTVSGTGSHSKSEF